MGRQGQSGNRRQQMTGSGQAMQQPQSRGSVNMTAMVALAANMQVQMLMAGVAITMAMFMGQAGQLQINSESRSALHVVRGSMKQHAWLRSYRNAVQPALRDIYICSLWFRF